MIQQVADVHLGWGQAPIPDQGFPSVPTKCVYARKI